MSFVAKSNYCKLQCKLTLFRSYWLFCRSIQCDLGKSDAKVGECIEEDGERRVSIFEWYAKNVHKNLWDCNFDQVDRLFISECFLQFCTKITIFLGLLWSMSIWCWSQKIGRIMHKFYRFKLSVFRNFPNMLRGNRCSWKTQHHYNIKANFSTLDVIKRRL